MVQSQHNCARCARCVLLLLLQVPDASFDFVAQNQGAVRSLPLWAGAAGFAGLLLNRSLSGVGSRRHPVTIIVMELRWQLL